MDQHGSCAKICSNKMTIPAKVLGCRHHFQYGFRPEQSLLILKITHHISSHGKGTTGGLGFLCTFIDLGITLTLSWIKSELESFKIDFSVSDGDEDSSFDGNQKKPMSLNALILS
mmetsp:Transcript_18927/g.28233  ORF Transcript_18927/g.28233 Transcript_18927/m.28233 type:complete len:115 (+) Transcript_18927:205-549(+)